MKKYLLISLFTIFLFTDCKNRKAEELSQQNEELTSTIRQRDSVMNELVATIAEIERNLGINTPPDSIAENISARIRENVNRLNEAIKLNEEKYNKLVGGSRKMNRELVNRLDSLNKELSRKINEAGSLNDQIAMLNQRIQGQDTTISQLRRNQSDQAAQVAQLKQQLNKAYYVSGSKKSLVDKGIITKEGGFLGIGRVEILNPQVKTEEFKPIDIQETKVIGFKAEKPEIITVHPPDSYTLRAEEDKAEIEILDPVKFWSASKYLVVVEK